MRWTDARLYYIALSSGVANRSLEHRSDKDPINVRTDMWSKSGWRLLGTEGDGRIDPFRLIS